MKRSKLLLKQLTKYLQLLIFLLLLMLIACPDPPNDSTESDPYKQEYIDWPSLADSPWPMYRQNPQWTGRYNGVRTQNINIHNIYEMDNIQKGSIIIGHNDKIIFSTTCDLVCIDENGNQLWKADMCEHLSGNYAEFNGAAIVTSDSLVIIGSWDHYLYCFEETLGSLLWKTELNETILQPLSITFYGTIIVSTIINDKKVYAINRKDGSIKWQINRGLMNIVQSPDGERLYGVEDWSIVAIDTLGNLLWENNQVRTMFLSVDNDGNIFGCNSMEKNVISLDKNGNERWKINFSDYSALEDIAPNGTLPVTIDANGNVIITGLSGNSNYLISISNDGILNYIINTSNEGLYDISEAIASDNNSNIYVSSYYGDDKEKYNTMAFNKYGEVIWSTPNDLYGHSGNIAFNSSGHLILSSNSRSPIRIKKIW